MTLARAQDVPTAEDGNQLVRTAATAVFEQPCLGAKIRQRATVMGQQVTGLGYYAQLHQEQRLLLRYEVKLQLAETSTSLLQVNDGDNLWIRRDKGPLQSQAYVSLRKLRIERAKHSAAQPPAPGTFAVELALGGLSQSLAHLAEYFQFAPPQESELKGLPIWELEGTWTQELWARLVPGNSAGTADWERLPEHLPDHVRLTLGRDQNFPLFPYRIEYLKTQRSSTVVGVASGQSSQILPLVTMELFEVGRPALTAADFTYQPSGTEDELTDAYLKKLGWIGDSAAEK
ncbi:MAG: hypothetical protein AB7O38_22075 [Pirellulaceae bacterium]